eukprot:1194761-Prorocentrum_minimum.AAC.1
MEAARQRERSPSTRSASRCAPVGRPPEYARGGALPLAGRKNMPPPQFSRSFSAVSPQFIHSLSTVYPQFIHSLSACIHSLAAVSPQFRRVQPPFIHSLAAVYLHFSAVMGVYPRADRRRERAPSGRHQRAHGRQRGGRGNVPPGPPRGGRLPDGANAGGPPPAAGA